MSDCIFCKIINGEIPSKKVLENDKFYALLKGYCHLFVMQQKSLVSLKMDIV